MNLSDLNKVWEIKPLKKDLEDEARTILERVAKQVQPIMRKWKWRVKVLSELGPADPSLLGLNIDWGAEIQLRLRWPSSDRNFLPYEEILDTMLHELCHNDYDAHNTDFYDLLDEIRKECKDLMAKGITGTRQGFDLPGRRLGGVSRTPPSQSLRKTALAAAENLARRRALIPGLKCLGGDNYIKAVLSPFQSLLKTAIAADEIRAHRGSLIPSGPKCLGGIKAVLSATQAAAMATERRLRDNLWRGSKSADGNQNIASSVESCETSNASTSNIGMSSQTPPHDSITRPDSVHDQTTWQCCVRTILNQVIMDLKLAVIFLI